MAMRSVGPANNAALDYRAGAFLEYPAGYARDESEVSLNGWVLTGSRDARADVERGIRATARKKGDADCDDER